MAIEKKLTLSEIFHDITRSQTLSVYSGKKVWGIPRGGVPIAIMVALVWDMIVVDLPEDADLIVDDIIATGETAKKFGDKYGKKVWAPYFADNSMVWYTFPWELSVKHEKRDNAVRLLQSVGNEPDDDRVDLITQFATEI